MTIRGNPALIVAAQRAWQVAAGLVTSLFILHFLSAPQQGWYYSFVSLAAFFTLFDLGLSLILIQRSATLFTDLRLDGRSGPEGRNAPGFAQLARYAHWWYTRAAAAFFLLLLPLGLWFFSGAARGASADTVEAHWPWLWASLLATTAINLWLLPFLSLIEGAGQVSSIYALRLAQGVAGSLATWALLVAGAGVWACVCMPVAAAAVGCGWLFWRQRSLYTLATGAPVERLDWRTTVWPQQWRLAVAWGSGYLLAQIYVPLLLRVEGPTAAGQMGISLTIANALALLSQSSLTHRYPEMAACAARGDWGRMLRVFGAAARIYAAAFGAGTVLFFVVLFLASDTPYVHRLLPWPALLTLFAATFLNQLATGFALALRAAGLEPFVWVTAAGAGLTMAAGLVLLREHGVLGLVVAMLCVQAFFVMPTTLAVWKRRQASWA